jgi:hypothetical protein
MRNKRVTLFAILGLVFSAVPAAGQVFCSPTGEEEEVDESDFAACMAATNTPFGALPTALPASWLGRTTTGIGFNVQFGNVDEEGDAGRRNLAVGIDIPAGRATFGLTGGFVDYTCDAPAGVDIECKSAIMLGARFATPLISSAITGGGTGQSVVVGLNTSVGFANGDILDLNDPFFGRIEAGGRSFSVGLGLPIGLVARSGPMTITPFVEPAFFWGRTRAEGTIDGQTETNSESGTGFVLGGGLSLGFSNGFALDFGVKKVMIDEANAMIGVGISFQR